ncbi:MAG TPA: nicotinate-nucleotide diphosphorylase (carboxylating), partial [Bacteroidales bacterium]|nr:nicotinate-nucleotide diphosphorylase (carboxylating) [Bacteroidales bacterium]
MASLEDFIRNAFAEDIGEGDHTSLSCIPASARGKSMLLIKEAGVVAGVRVALEVFRLFDPQLQTTVFIQDGQKVKPGDIVFETAGSVRSLLQTERLMLNIMQRMSGIATTTRLYADRLQGLHTKVIDTR